MQGRHHTLVCDFDRRGIIHADLNAALVAIVHAAGGEPGSITFMAEPDHLERMQAHLVEHDVHGIQFEKSSSVPLTGGARQLLDEFRLFSRLHRAIRHGGYERVIWASCQQPRIKWVRWLAARNPGCRFAAILHEPLQHEPAGSSRSWGRRVLQSRLPSSDPENLVYLMYSISIARNVEKEFGEIVGRVRGIEHPCAVPALERSESIDSSCIRFGFIGYPFPKKGFSSFCELASRTASGPHPDRATFMLVGKAPTPELSPPQVSAVEMPGGQGVLSREKFGELFSTLDYAVFPFDPEIYRYQASGSFIESLARGIPVIVLSNECFRPYFEELGDIGYACESLDELTATIEQLIAAHPDTRYKEQRTRLQAQRTRFEPRNLAPEYEQLWT